MSGEELSRDPEVEEINDRLQSGLETCRFVIANYRSLLSNERATGVAGAEGRCGEASALSEEARGDAA